MHRACEELEKRQMLATWTALPTSPAGNPHTVPASVGVANLLSDGSVLVHGQADNATKNWYKLTPDSSGSYTNGTWTTLMPMSLERLFFASNILQDGRVFVMGGEYSGSGTSNTFTNTGEIYDPVSNSWQAIPNFPLTKFGDDPTEVLDNGKVLAGYLLGPATYLFNPAANSWATTGTKLNSDPSDEETWIKLGDNTVLSWDVFANPHSQRYSPSTGLWSQAGDTIATQSLTQLGHELGPGLRIPDGRAVQFGASPHNAIYDPATNSWAYLMDTPGSLGGNDAPGAEMPSGHILYAAGDTSTAFGAGTTFFDVDPVANTFTAINGPTGGIFAPPPFFVNMLVLPTGQIMVTQNSNAVYIYTPDGSPSDAWRTTVSNVVNNNDGTFTLSGTLLNGVSEGASYGDDAEMSSNYPIIRLTDSSGTVKFARSFNWNKTGVGPSSATTTKFTLPAGVTSGAYKMNVIANGIASKDYLLVVTGGSVNNVTVETDPNNSSNVRVMNGAVQLGSFGAASFVQGFVVGTSGSETISINTSFSTLPLLVNASGGVDTINVNGAAAPVTVNAEDGNDIINIGGGNMDNITANISVVGGNGSDTVNFDDSVNSTNNTYTLGSTSVTKASQPAVSYSFDTELLTLTGGTGADTINVPGLSIPSTVNGGGGTDAINIIAPESQSVVAQGGAGTDTVFIVGTSGGNTFTVSDTTVGGNVNVSYASDVENLEVDANGGSDTITVNNTSASTAVTLDAGAAADFIDVEGSAVGSPVNITNSSNQDTITVHNGAAQFSGAGNAASLVNVEPGGSLDASSGDVDFTTLDLDGGSLTGSSKVTIDGTMNWVAGSSSGTGLLVIGAGATMTDSVPGTSRSKALVMSGSGSLAAGGARLLVTSGFSYSGTGALDLNDNDMIVDYVSGPQIASINAAIVAARTGGSWTGPGLTSSAAQADPQMITTLGAMEATDYKTINPGATTFDGEPIDNTAIVIKYTYYGDANFSGNVDGADYAHIDGTFNTEHTAGNIGGWMNGDFNGDGMVDGADYALIDSAFNGQTTVLRPPRPSLGGGIVGLANPLPAKPAAGKIAGGGAAGGAMKK